MPNTTNCKICVNIKVQRLLKPFNAQRWSTRSFLKLWHVTWFSTSFVFWMYFANVKPLIISMPCYNSMVSSKTSFCSSSITLLCNMTHAINTFAITMRSHKQEALATICHFDCNTLKQRSTSLRVASMTHAINTFAITMRSHKQEALATIYHFDCNTSKQCSTSLRVASCIFKKC